MYSIYKIDLITKTVQTLDKTRWPLCVYSYLAYVTKSINVNIKFYSPSMGLSGQVISWLVLLIFCWQHKTLILDVPQNTCVISNRLYKSVTLHRLTDIMTKWLLWLCVIDTKVLISSGHLFLFLPAAELKEILCGYSNLYHLSRLLKSAHECRQWNPLHLVDNISVQYFQLSVFVCLDLANE